MNKPLRNDERAGRDPVHAGPDTLGVLPGMLMDEMDPTLRKIIAYSEICHSHHSIDDAHGYIEAADKLINEARTLAKFLRDMKLCFQPPKDIVR
ncbi:MAG: hypothetical protein WDN46_23050 [Methylocella sp.]